MTVMVDDAFIPARVGRHSSRWCHLMSDASVEELHEFAQRIGCRRSWFQDHPNLAHYDLTEAMRRKAIAAGAREVSSKEMARAMWRKIREQREAEDG